MAVADVDQTTEKVKKAGGHICVEKMNIPGVGWIVYFKDTEGNLCSALSPDESCKPPKAEKAKDCGCGCTPKDR